MEQDLDGAVRPPEQAVHLATLEIDQSKIRAEPPSRSRSCTLPLSPRIPSRPQTTPPVSQPPHIPVGEEQRESSKFGLASNSLSKQPGASGTIDEPIDLTFEDSDSEGPMKDALPGDSVYPHEPRLAFEHDTDLLVDLPMDVDDEQPQPKVANEDDTESHNPAEEPPKGTTSPPPNSSPAVKLGGREEPPSMVFGLQIDHLDLIYHTENTSMFCRLCV